MAPRDAEHALHAVSSVADRTYRIAQMRGLSPCEIAGSSGRLSALKSQSTVRSGTEVPRQRHHFAWRLARRSHCRGARCAFAYRGVRLPHVYLRSACSRPVLRQRRLRAARDYSTIKCNPHISLYRFDALKHPGAHERQTHDENLRAISPRCAPVATLPERYGNAGADLCMRPHISVKRRY